MRISLRFHRYATRFPVGMFLAVTAVYSGLVAGVIALAGSNPPMLAVVPYAWAPLVGAGVTVWVRGDSLRGWVGQLRSWRVGSHWYLLGIATVVLGTDVENLVALLLGADVGVQAGSGIPFSQYLFAFGATLVLAGAIEEFGWRGFMQPHLQQRYSALTASVLVGITWALWHVPIIVVGVSGISRAFATYLVLTVGISIILGWLYNTTGGSLPVVMVTHAASNMAAILVIRGHVPALIEAVPIGVIFYSVCALVVVLYAGPLTLTRDGSVLQPPGMTSAKDAPAGD